MKKILAVSGGIDSMVLLDIFYKKEPENILVAHFNHGTRDSADLDMTFVENKCKNLKIPFEYSKLILGEGVSEEEARQKRYEFLYHVANKYHGIIYTAHHLDDMIESVAINLIRGTGWRGLTPFGNSKIKRPLVELGYFKQDILRYAAVNQIKFRQDPTNYSDNYLRNRIREKLKECSLDLRKMIIEKCLKQREIREQIESLNFEICNRLLINDTYNKQEIDSSSSLKFRKDFFIKEDEVVLEEILRYICLKKSIALTRPQLDDFIYAVKTYKTNKKFNLPKDKMAVIGRDFVTL